MIRHKAGPDVVLSMRRGRIFKDRKKEQNKQACRAKSAPILKRGKNG